LDTPELHCVAPVTDGQEAAKSRETSWLGHEGADASRLLASLIESSHDAIIGESLEGTITFWNAAAERIFGFTADEAVGAPSRIIVPPDRLEEESKILAQVRRGERAQPLETVRIAKDGRRVEVSIAVAPILDSQGRILGASTIVRDIGEQKHAQAELQATRDRLTSDLAGMRLLNELNIEMAQKGDLRSLLEEILGAAIRITHADSGMVQLYDQLQGTLQVVAQRGFESDFLELHQNASSDEGVCGTAIARAQRVVVEDVNDSPLFSGPMLQAVRKAGVAAVQATPLFAFSGRVVGVFCTYYRTPRRPDEDELRLVDRLARHAADFIERTQTEEVLECALDRMNLVLSSITESYFALDSHYRFVEVNPAALRTIFRNLPATELIGRGIWEVFPEGRGTEFDRQYHRAMEEQREVHFEGQSRIVDKWFEAHAYPRGGRLEVYVRDITERKKAAEALAASEAEFRAMFEQSAAGATEADPATGRFVRVNRRFCEIMGYGEEELQARTICDVTHSDDQSRDREIAARVLQGECESWEIEKRYLRKDGGIAWAVVAGRMIRDAEGRPLRAISTVIDITDRKRAEEEVRRKVEELADSDRRKDDFLALLGHELRNPLAAVVNGAQVLDLSHAVVPEARSILDIIQRQTRHMRRLIDDLLDISRISRGKVTLRRERVALNDLVEKTVADHRSLVDDVGCTLDVQIPSRRLWVYGDSTRVAQVLGNLLHNACKFTDPGGKITLKLCEQKAPPSAVISIRDTGIGMSRATLDRMFDTFRQGESNEGERRGGLGLGLALVKGLVELHGGTVAAQSDGPGSGSEFTVRFPLAVTGDATSPNQDITPLASTPELEEPYGRFRILVVDDTAPVATMFGLLLESLGHEAQTAESGPAALEMAVHFRPQIVFSDIAMPDMTGYELARRLRALPGGRDLVLVAMTGYGQPQDRQRSLEAGFDYHLVKPAETNALEELFLTITRDRLREHVSL
jgi:PAS domain S-box-containing protein